jgi:NDP-sugar pyrophosphorylase family protein
MKVIILAGGKATRLPNSAKDLPKALVDIGGKPLLAHQLELLERHGLKDIRLSLGFKAEQIIEWLAGRYEYVIEPEPLGTGGALKFASRDLKEEFIAVNGDILSDLHLKDFINHWQKTLTRNKELMGSLAAWQCPDARDYGLMKIRDGLVREFLEKENKRQKGYINAGFYILSPKVFQGIKKKTFSIEKEIFPRLSQRGQLAAYMHKGRWLDVGTEERLLWAKKNLHILMPG